MPLLPHGWLSKETLKESTRWIRTYGLLDAEWQADQLGIELFTY